MLHFDPSYDGDGFFGKPASFKFIFQGLLNLVTESTLGIGYTANQWNKMHPLVFISDFRSPQNESHLGPVSMGDNNFNIVFDNVHDIAH